MHSNSTPAVDIPRVPKDYAGKWVAWNNEGSRIVASGATLVEAIKAAAESGYTAPRFEKIPPADARIVGRKP